MNAPLPITAAMPLEAIERDAEGWGSLPGLPFDAYSYRADQADLDKLTDYCQQNGFDVQWTRISRYRNDKEFKKATQEWESGGSVAKWSPPAPDSKDYGASAWTLAAVLYAEGVLKEGVVVREGEEPGADDLGDDAFALWLKPRPVAQDPDTTHAHARMFLIGNLLATTKRALSRVPGWDKASEELQASILSDALADTKDAARQAIQAISSNERLSFRAEVDNVTFKGRTDVKAAIKMVANHEAHALADTAGGFVTVVIEDVSELLDIPEGITDGDPDTRPLFDTSTEG